MVKFIHTADWQLGMTRHFLAGEAQARFDGSRIDVIKTIGKLATEQDCSFVVVCGDVFEHNQVSWEVVGRALDAMAATPQVVFYLLAGNHDPLDASSLYTSGTFLAHKPDNVVVLDSSVPVEVTPGVELIAAPWYTKRPLTDLVAEACAHLQPNGTVRIAVGHGAVDSLSPDDANPALIGLGPIEAAIADERVHYVALGDRHSTTNAGNTGRVWYSGAPEPTDYRETDPGKALVVTLDTHECAVEQHSVGTWRFVSHDQELTSADDVDTLEGWLNSLERKDRTIVKLSLVGQLSLSQKTRLEEMLNLQGLVLASLNTWERHSHLVVKPTDADLENLCLSGAAQQTLHTLMDMSNSTGTAAEDAQEALALLYRLTQQGEQR
ncbi:MAG: exonuclease SbcCD subunit D [bacterium]|nr:exonuclease SbcCD subunit D [bacterium]